MGRIKPQEDPIPVVFVEGFAAGTPATLWHGIDDLINERRPLDSPKRRLIIIKCGCFSSWHDRAAEIYYSLKGGRCDYGAEHAEKHTHARLGVDYGEGLYPQWSSEHPLHFIGHSFGGVTIFHMQQQLSRELPGSPDWMRSITTISSPHKGTPLNQALGQLDGPAPGHQPYSPTFALALGVHIGRTLQMIGSDIYDLGGMHWLKDDTHTTNYGIIDAICDFVTGRAEGFSADCAGHDMLMRVAADHNTSTKLFPKTYYRSYTASTTQPRYMPPLGYSWRLVNEFPHQEEVSPDWRENDALIPLASQYHPRECDETTCIHFPTALTFNNEPPPVPAAWHVKHYPETTHLGLCNYLWRLGFSAKTKLFWNEYGDWIRLIEEIPSSI